MLSALLTSPARLDVSLLHIMSSITSASAASLTYAAYDAALTADLAAYERIDLAGRAFDAARIALDAAREAFTAARKEREDAATAADLSFAARTAAFKAWDAASTVNTLRN